MIPKSYVSNYKISVDRKRLKKMKNLASKLSDLNGYCFLSMHHGKLPSKDYMQIVDFYFKEIGLY